MRPVPSLSAIQVSQNKLLRVVSESPYNNLDSVLTEQVLSPDAHTTSYENSCYCKPQAGYFREIAERLGFFGGFEVSL